MDFRAAIKLLATWLDEKEEAEMSSTRGTSQLRCMPAHLPEDLAAHVCRKAAEREWSNSQYLKYLVMQDKKRCADEEYFMEEATGLSTEQFEQCERNKKA